MLLVQIVSLFFSFERDGVERESRERERERKRREREGGGRKESHR